MYLLSYQGSNVDGSLIRAICDAFGIEKRRSSAYHSQGNGFAERNIRNIREILRSVLLDRDIPHHEWRSVLQEVVFSLNTSTSTATNAVPYDVVFGRQAILPQDITLGLRERYTLQDATTAEQYAEDVSFGLNRTFQTVIRNLQVSRDKMERKYNKNLRLRDFNEGDKVWIKLKHYKPGENRKLSPGKCGPYIIIQKLPNGVNFKVRNLSTDKEKIVHHDRLSPYVARPPEDPELEDEFEPVNHQQERGIDPPCIDHENVETDSDEEIIPDRYPMRERRQRVIEGAIPWNAVDG